MSKVIKKCRHCFKNYVSQEARNRMYCSRKCSDQNVVKKKTVEERFKEKFIKLSNGCWEWIASKDARGYGMFHVENQDSSTTHNKRAHIVSWLLAGNIIPPQHELDHLCRNHSCVNPNHLEAVTHKVNSLRGFAPSALNARKTHCHRGHEFSIENTYRYSDGRRDCKICMRIRYNNRVSKRSSSFAS